MRTASSCLVAVIAAFVIACEPNESRGPALDAAADAGMDGSSDAGPGPGTVPQRADVLYETALWTSPAGSSLATPASCRIRALPGCEGLALPEMLDTALTGDRLVVLMVRDGRSAPGVWDLLVSDDRGKTVRRFSLDGVTGNGRDGRLHLVGRRIFVLASATDPVLHTVGSSRVFEIDPDDGAVIPRGAGVMSSARGHAAADGVLTTVAYARISAPQMISVTRFDPTTNAIHGDEIACNDPACELGSESFISSDGETFNLLAHPSASALANQGCLVSVTASNQTVGVECSAAWPRTVQPFISVGGKAYDFAVLGPTDVPSWSLVPTVRNWVPAGPALPMPADKVGWFGDGFFAYSPSAHVTAGDGVLGRVTPSGSLQTTALQHEGCLDIEYHPDGRDCARTVRILALPGDEVLFIAVRDEFHDGLNSRLLFEVGHSRAPFAPFQP
jgi:hypothetical protein